MKRWLPILLALAPTYLIRFSIGGVPTTLFEILIYVVAIAVFVTGVISWKKLQERLSPWVWLGLFLILVGTGIGFAISQDYRTAAGIAKAFVFDPLILAALIVGSLDHEDLPSLLGAYLLSSALVSLASIAGWLTEAAWAITADGRLLGLYGLEANASPNYLAFWTAPAIALGIAWVATPPWPLKRWQRLIPIATALSAIALVGSASRAGIGAALIAGVLALALYYKSALAELRYAQGLSWLLLIGLVAFAIGVVQPDFGLSPQDGGRITTSNNIRWEIWRTTGELLRQDHAAITGVGLGDYQSQFAARTNGRVNYDEFITPRALTPHNLFLNTWVNQGLLGLVGLVIVLTVAAKQLWRAEPTVGATLVSALLLTIVLQGLVDTPTWKNDTSVLLWVGISAACLAAFRSDNPHRR